MASLEADFFAHRRTTASHTIGVPYLSDLLTEVSVDAPYDEYAAAVVETNVLGRSSHVGRLRVLRHLRELYVLDPADTPFRVLRTLQQIDRESLPLMAGLLALTHDEFFRASWLAVAAMTPGERARPEQLGDTVAQQFGPAIAPATFAKVGRNVAASWSQTGHLSGTRIKVRSRVTARPAGIAFALALAHLAGMRGQGLLTTTWFASLDLVPEEVPEALDSVHRSGLVDIHRAGSVLEVNPTRLIRGTMT
jgi:hypothetical protein